MARYFSRPCPRCGEYLGAVMPVRSPKTNTQPVNGFCAACGYELRWTLIHGRATQRSDFWSSGREEEGGSSRPHVLLHLLALGGFFGALSNEGFNLLGGFQPINRNPG